MLRTTRVQFMTRILCSGLLAWSLALAAPAFGALLDNRYAITDFTYARTFAGGSSTDRLITTGALLANHGDACALSVSRWAPGDPTWNVPGSDTHLKLFLPMGYGDNLAAQPFEEPFSFSGWTALVTGATLTTWTGLAHTRYWRCMDAP